MNRRTFFNKSIAGAVTLLSSTESFASSGSTSISSIVSYLLSDSSSGGHPGNPNPAFGELAIPPLLDPRPRAGIKHFDLKIRRGSQQFFEGINTQTYGISADYLGPTLLLRRGEEVSLNYKNSLSESTTMHGHGMHLPAAMDGGPHQMIRPGATWSARYKVDQKACTNWYHPHLMGKTAEHVYKGLAGLIYIEDDESKSLSLPKHYAKDDIPLVIQDRRFDQAGGIDYSPTRQEIRQGYMGDTFLVNGVIQPYFNAEAGLLRMRLLNGSNARVYRFAFSDNRKFSLISGDNSFLPKPIKMRNITLSPGERAEIIVDLKNDFGEQLVFEDMNSNTQLLRLKVNKRSSVHAAIPPTLTRSLEIPNLSAGRYTRRFDLGMRQMHMTINGKVMDMNRIDERVPLGRLEVWDVRNTMGMNHNFHIHATHFIVAERNGSASNVKPWEKGYKDVVFMPPYSRVKLLVKMIDYRDSSTPYMYHCHILEHEDDGMMGQFTVV